MNQPTEGAQGSENSPTPLTDTKFIELLEVRENNSMWDIAHGMRHHARQLERQLAQSEERVKELEVALEYIAALHASRDTLLKEMTHDKASALLSSSKTN